MGYILPPSTTEARFAIRSAINIFPPQALDPEDTKEATSKLGTPIYDQVILDTKNTDLAEGRLDPETNLDAGSLVLNEVVTTVTQSKIIVKTPINGKNGTVKEYIGLGDYLINIRGFLVGDNHNERPQELIDKLIAFSELEKQIVIASRIINSFKITSVVIDKCTIDQESGVRNRVPFILNCSSDQDEEIKLSADVNT